MSQSPANGKVPPATLKLLRARTARVADILESSLGTPRQEAPLPHPLDMLIATILSQNTNDKNSHRAYVQLRKKFRRWGDVASARVSGIISSIPRDWSKFHTRRG